MKYSQLRKKIEHAGCTLLRHGSSHDIYLNTITGEKFAIGRHGTEEVKPGTLKKILTAAGIK